MKWRTFTVAAVVLSSLCASHAAPLAAQSMAEDKLANHLVGEWEGQGNYEGNTLYVTRAWTLELWNGFMRGDMRVTMDSGSSFAALTYWKPTGAGEYTVVAGAK